jgi:hypothetical protein
MSCASLCTFTHTYTHIHRVHLHDTHKAVLLTYLPLFLLRYISIMARCMLEYGGVARDMWGYAVRYATYVQNRIVHAGQTRSPFVARFETAADLSRLKVFGCAAYVTRDKKETDYVSDKKLDPRSVSGCFVGMADDGDSGVHSKEHMVFRNRSTTSYVITSYI